MYDAQTSDAKRKEKKNKVVKCQSRLVMTWATEGDCLVDDEMATIYTDYEVNNEGALFGRVSVGQVRICAKKKH